MTRTDAYLAAIVAVILLVIGLTTLITGVLTSTEIGPAIITGTITTTTGAAASLVTGYRAAQHHTREHTNRAARALIRGIVAHDARLAAEPPDENVAPLAAQARRPQRKTTT
ncbi:hypothetical protein ABZ690_19400 [Streptomyces sp. NPDC006967]|uniref:hypothetical protein n=1 Tax=unclassified Streptomyces TaxID=2593676 RepID=UPI0033EC8A88